MLRMYLMQIWFNLSDAAIEDAMRSFMRIDFAQEQVPDATTLLKFRHLLEKHHIGEKISADVKRRLDERGLIMHGGTIVDATIIRGCVVFTIMIQYPCPTVSQTIHRHIAYIFLIHQIITIRKGEQSQ